MSFKYKENEMSNNNKDNQIQKYNIPTSDDSIEKQQSSNNKNLQLLNDVIFILLFLFPALSFFFVCVFQVYNKYLLFIGIFNLLSIILGLTLLTYVRIKYPKDTTSKSTLHTVIILICILIILFLIFYHYCVLPLEKCDLSG